MKHWNWKAIGTFSAVVAALSVARLGVSLGRLIYYLHIGAENVGGDPLPTWQSLLFGDVFFYLGVAALVLAAVSILRLRKSEEA